MTQQFHPLDFRPGEKKVHVYAKTGIQMLKGVLFTAAESGSNANGHLLANGDTKCDSFTHRDVLPPNKPVKP